MPKASIRVVDGSWRSQRPHQIHNRPRAGSNPDVPGGSTGLFRKDYKGKEADTPVYKVDTGLLAELRALEQQAAEELAKWYRDTNGASRAPAPSAKGSGLEVRGRRPRSRDV